MNASAILRLDQPGHRLSSSLADSKEAIFGPLESLDPIPGKSGILIGLERRSFFQGCLALWLSSFCQEFGTAVIAGFSEVAEAAPLDQAVFVIIGVGDPSGDATWIQEQISWLRDRDLDLPVALLADDAHHEEVEEIAMRLGLQGHIPTSTRVEVAAAAARLIVAGGSYFPRVKTELAIAPVPVPADVTEGPSVFAVAKTLTPREDAVLELLGRGTPNKIIAYRLGISISTAKVHVHNIMKKLNARNRTEVALIARRLRHTASRTANAA